MYRYFYDILFLTSYPREIEQVVSTHEAVLKVAVVGISVDNWGELVKAYVVKKKNEHCRG